MIGLPPSAGGVQRTTAEDAVSVAAGEPGAAGGVASGSGAVGVTGVLVTVEEVPTALVAVREKV